MHFNQFYFLTCAPDRFLDWSHNSTCRSNIAEKNRNLRLQSRLLFKVLFFKVPLFKVPLFKVPLFKVWYRVVSATRISCMQWVHACTKNHTWEGNVKTGRTVGEVIQWALTNVSIKSRSVISVITLTLRLRISTRRLIISVCVQSVCSFQL